MTVTILCEGPSCNGGFSAKVREDAMFGRNISEAQRGAAYEHARCSVSKLLAYTPHTRVGVGASTYACDECGFERIYG